MAFKTKTHGLEDYLYSLECDEFVVSNFFTDHVSDEDTAVIKYTRVQDLWKSLNQISKRSNCYRPVHPHLIVETKDNRDKKLRTFNIYKVNAINIRLQFTGPASQEAICFTASS